MFNFGRTQTIGKIGELAAQKEYVKRGFKIVRQNVFNRYGKQAGEVDFIAKKDNMLVFVEVKTRTGESRFGTAFEAVDQFKQVKLVKALKLFLRSNRRFSEFSPRIDVCEVRVNSLDKRVEFVKVIESAVQDVF
ncbi:MAG TPA: YraN family protein [Patescibacteria group bacterium]|nr:YraN family protein [Patescibacteria group bacterium]